MRKALACVEGQTEETFIQDVPYPIRFRDDAMQGYNKNSGG